ncbi:FkbM family methyltransferase [Ruegeria halocynthiae]|uniref:FkbM family methyltransferase n=1 Tax=Ruegeria halocynthiae TaxID=985054 RepID=UPI000559EFB9|nr:FkbM family methyltransferase [Ruegeria halocynthiae]
MASANPFDFVKTLRALGLEFTPINAGESSIAGRPMRILRRLSRSGYSIERTELDARLLAGYGFAPSVVFDIGVDAGTPPLYDAFNTAKFVLIDPVAESEDKVAPWKNKINFDFHCVAAGSSDGSVTLNVPSTTSRVRHSRASIMEYKDNYVSQFAKIEQRVVPVRTLDSLSRGLSGPFGIKIDSEGYEIEVIKGATETLKQSEFVIAETSVKPRYENGYKFSDFVALMAENGFEILDFIRPIRPGRPDCDVLFARMDSGRFDL